MPNMEYKVDTNDKDTSPSPSPGSAQALTFTPPPAYSATPADSTQVAFTLVHAEGNSSHGYVPGLAQNHRSTLKSTTNGTTKHGRREDVTLTDRPSPPAFSFNGRGDSGHQDIIPIPVPNAPRLGTLELEDAEPAHWASQTWAERNPASVITDSRFASGLLSSTGLERLRTFPNRGAIPRPNSGPSHGRTSGRTHGLGLENLAAPPNPSIFQFDEEMMEDEYSEPVVPRGRY